MLFAVVVGLVQRCQERRRTSWCRQPPRMQTVAWMLSILITSSVRGRALKRVRTLIAPRQWTTGESNHRRQLPDPLILLGFRGPLFRFVFPTVVERLAIPYLRQAQRRSRTSSLPSRSAPSLPEFDPRAVPSREHTDDRDRTHIIPSLGIVTRSRISSICRRYGYYYPIS